MAPKRTTPSKDPCRLPASGLAIGLAIGLALALALAAGGCSYSLVAGDQLRREPFDEVAARTARARGIEPQGELRAQVLDQAEIREVLRETVEEEWPAEAIRAYEAALVALGLWPRDRDLAETFLDVMSQELLGVYVPGQNTLYVVSDIAPPPFWFRAISSMHRRDYYREAILAHEIVHLLQHQRYPELVELGDMAHHNDDLVGAVQAALEGDATRYGLAAMELGRPIPQPDSYTDTLHSELESREGSALADAPAIIRLTLTYPYVRGYRLAYEEGLELLDDPPASTEQVLHADKRREAFTAIDLGGPHAALPPGCEFAHENSMGELNLSVLFSDLGNAADAEVWQGWDGDRYLVARCNDRLEFFWLSQWDSRSDAMEFEEAYGAIAPAVAQRAGHAAPPVARRVERQVVVTTQGLAELVEALSSGARRQSVTSFDDYVDWWSSR
ncbi:MAG: hypothetical protein JRH19_20510 [Deltaproteobacteria bacterium]|nr:hypothetical protein [Deltaproteobacteria bacterium]